MNKENYALKLVDEIILYYDERSKKHQIWQYCLLVTVRSLCMFRTLSATIIRSTKKL